MLADEPVERSFGRRPRAPLKEELLLRLDKARLARERLLAAKRTDESWLECQPVDFHNQHRVDTA